MSIYRSNSTHRSSIDHLSHPTTRDSFENTSYSRYNPQKSTRKRQEDISFHKEKSRERLELDRIMSATFKRESEETKPEDISFNNISSVLQIEVNSHENQKFYEGISRENRKFQEVSYRNPKFDKENTKRFYEENAENDGNLEKFNENSMHFARILNQIVDKICNDIEGRLSRMEIRMEVLERIAKNHEEKSLSQRGGRKAESLWEIQAKFKKFEKKLEDLENFYRELNTEVFVKHNQISTTMDTNLQKFLEISEVLNKKLTSFSTTKKPEEFLMNTVEKRLKELEKIKDNMVENEINSENQRALLGKLEDDMVRMISSMKDINELVMISRLNSSEILALKSKQRDLFDCFARLTEKRANSHR